MLKLDYPYNKLSIDIFYVNMSQYVHYKIRILPLKILSTGSHISAGFKLASGVTVTPN